ncbi:putative amino acid racemase [Halobacteroides halobius DSM 5150]|uniref:Putative amino acid racemase n=1 Tax=Halobacteroides halobius (strain ATCC 35273 / DSM 5150 / MD-1) TaxID=748449 RepID=L0K5E5_HALHC|nr:alanine/ornithine racemase family PLP-dependent enzyme [Halobacteroides halobius]AGB40236.1 putative amino acid racemase [Halobacteroides halobius DSM 5150]
MGAEIEINLTLLQENTAQIIDLASKDKIDIWGVTKGVCGDLKVAEAMIDGGVSGLADSRLSNLAQLNYLDIPLLLLRIPMLSEVDKVVKYADISLNSELEVVQALNKAAQESNSIHQVILLVDLGDRREGMLPSDLMETIHKVKQLGNIKLIGLGTNLACFRGVLPTQEKMAELNKLVQEARERFDLKLPIVSGGNSSSLPLLLKDNYSPVSNQFRIGETILLGREVPSGESFANISLDAFKLTAEVIELKEKSTAIEDEVTENAFDQIKEVVDKGIRKRAILAVGRQDIYPQGLTSLTKGITIEGASSDHLIIDVINNSDIKLGSKIEFRLNYAALLQAMTSPYVKKVYRED